MCVLGLISRSHARNGNEIQTSGRRGSAVKIEKLGFLIPVNPKHPENHETWHRAMTWHQNDAVIFFCRIGTSFGERLSKTGASLKKARGSERERVISVCETTYVHCLLPPYFLHRQIRPNRSIVLNFGIIPGSFGLFYTLIEFLGI